MFATLNRSLYDAASPHHPLLTTGPHDCFPFLDMDDMLGNHDHNRPVTSLDHDHDDRDGGDGMINNYVPPTSTTQLFATHLPYSLLPKSVTTSSSTCSVSKFVYVYRNPKDVFISSWIFASKVRAINTRLAPFSLEEAFEIFCRGVCPYGPYWDHVLGFWKASLEMPEQVWFLKYEDLKKEPSANVKRLAEFLGQPFSEEEESKGVVQQIIKLCSFENLSSLEVNKTSRTQQYFVKANIVFENSDFFRKGQVGDWKNFFTDDMAKCMDQIVDERFSGSGLTFANPTSTKTCLRDADNFVAQSMFARRDAQDVAQVIFARRNFARRRYASRKVTTCATSCVSCKTCTSRKSLAPNHACFTVFSTFARRLASSRKVNAKIYIFIFLSSVLIQVKSSIAAFPSSSPANLHSRLITFFGIILFSFVRG
ncbi:flavonol sulfotransferase-like isoform X1 [Malus domestica]|uniref:flavonol sulfotransferase-like isoform X1 n=1 Tax=Malus domestica TaxID=3750 RepID=UPI003976B806